MPTRSHLAIPPFAPFGQKAIYCCVLVRRLHFRKLSFLPLRALFVLLIGLDDSYQKLAFKPHQALRKK